MSCVARVIALIPSNITPPVFQLTRDPRPPLAPGTVAARMHLGLAARRSGPVMLRRVPYRPEVVGRVKLGAVATPRTLLDHAIDRAKFVGRDAQRHDLADAHHHVP